jgi:hypothetical protein
MKLTCIRLFVYITYTHQRPSYQKDVDTLLHYINQHTLVHTCTSKHDTSKTLKDIRSRYVRLPAQKRFKTLTLMH